MKIRFLNIIASLLLAFSQWLQIIIITNFLGLSDVGVFTLIIAILGPMVLMSRYSFFSLIPTENYHQLSLNKYKSARIIFNILYLTIIIFLLIVLQIDWYSKICLILYAIFKFYENQEEFIYIENVVRKNLKFLAYSKIIKSILSIVLFYFCIFFSNSLIIGIIGLIISQIAIYYVWDKRFSTLARSTYRLKMIDFKIILKLGMSLTIVSIFTSLVTNIPRYTIEFYYDSSTLGIYATLLYFVLLANNVTITLNTTFIVDFTESLEKGKKYFVKKFVRIMLIYTLLGLIAFLIFSIYGSEILSSVYGLNYDNYEDEILLLSIYLMLTILSKYMEMILNVLNAYLDQAKIHFFSLILTLLLSLMLIPEHGLAGALFVNVTTFILVIVVQISLIIGRLRRRIYE